MEKELEKKLIKKILLSPIMIGVFVLVLFSCVGASYAATTIFSSSEVGFNNTRTNIQSTNVQGAIDELYSKATDYSSMNTRLTAVEDYKNQIYPVGSIYIGVNNTNPSTLFGGTWESFGEGRTLIGVGTGTDSNSTQKVFASNETGGEYNHTLTVNEMPSHSHTSNAVGIKTGYTDSSASTMAAMRGVNRSNQYEYQNAEYTNNTGGSQSHNIIQPYITVYMWKRTA